MQVPINEAKTQLSRLIELSLSGEEVIIARGQKPVARLVPIKGGFKFGVMPGSATDVPDFSEPMDDQDLVDWAAL